MAAPRTSLTKNGQMTDAELATRTTDTESLPTLFSRLGDDVMQLFNSQLALFKVEIKEEASAYARGITMIAIGAVIAVVGFALLISAFPTLAICGFAGSAVGIISELYSGRWRHG